MTQQWGNQGQQWPQQGWNRGTPAWGQPQYPQGQPPQPGAQYPGAQYPAAPQYPGGQYPAAPQYPNAPAAGQAYPTSAVPQQGYPVGQAPVSQTYHSGQAYRAPGYPQAQFGQPAYGQPGTFASPKRPGGPRRSPVGGVILGLVLVVGIAFFALTLLHYLNADEDAAATPGSSQTVSPSSPSAPSQDVPAPDKNPPDLPQPETYQQAESWLTNNAVYRQTAPVPTDCVVPQIDITAASASQLTTHLNDLTACLWRVWSGPLEEAGFELPRPPVTVYTSPITTGCGKLEDVNAVYCAADQRIYYARPLWKIFPADQQQQRFVIESVLAHEFGHTIQARTGILISSMAFEQKVSSSQAKVYSRRLEAQADCFSGMFTEAVGPSSGLSSSDLNKLGEVFYNLGDDVLSGQANIQGDHGLGTSRRTWFLTGQSNTLIGKCNTYTASASSVR